MSHRWNKTTIHPETGDEIKISYDPFADRIEYSWPGNQGTVCPDTMREAARHSKDTVWDVIYRAAMSEMDELPEPEYFTGGY